MGVILNGKALSEEILAQVAVEVESLKKNGIAPKLCVILVGDNPASLSYVNMKHRACERTGIISQILKFGDDISQNALLCEIERLNNDKSVNGILVQLPLPKHISTDSVLEAICPTKDVDGFHPYNIGRLVANCADNSGNSGNLSWGMRFRTCKNFWDSTDSKSSFYPKNSYKYKSHTAITSMVASSCRSRKSLRIVDFAESAESMEKNAESTLDSTNPQNLTRKNTESTIDSANPTSDAESANKAQQTIEGIAVEVAEFLPNFECETRVCERSKFGKSPQDAPKTKLQTSESQKTNALCGSILDEKSGLCSHERGNKTDSLLTKQVANSPIYRQKTIAQNTPILAPATPLGVMELLKAYHIEVSGKNVAIIGASNIVGKPLSALMLNAGATISVCHILTKDISVFTKSADIVCVGVGKANLIRADMVKDGAIVVDIGINKVNGKIVGDVDFEGVAQKASFITPVPGGVGPMTIAMLLKNTILCAKANSPCSDFAESTAESNAESIAESPAESTPKGQQ